jgi:orotate phosphoribosyltransferase
MQAHQRAFLQLALHYQVLSFGRFTLKSGRVSPYFFNAGLFNTGQALKQLGRAFATTLAQSNLAYDMLFGPAYKGIALATSTAIALAEAHGRDLPVAFNRKEVKDHGEAGIIIGAPLKGRVLIIDDVITAGTSVREAVALIEAQGAVAAGVLIALDRQEVGIGALSATEEVRRQFGLPVLAIAGLDELLTLVAEDPQLVQHRDTLIDYRKRYGVASSVAP